MAGMGWWGQGILDHLQCGWCFPELRALTCIVKPFPSTERPGTETYGPTRRTMRTAHVQGHGVSQQWWSCQELFTPVAHWALSSFPLLCASIHWIATEVSKEIKRCPQWNRELVGIVGFQIIDYLVCFLPSVTGDFWGGNREHNNISWRAPVHVHWKFLYFWPLFYNHPLRDNDNMCIPNFPSENEIHFSDAINP